MLVAIVLLLAAILIALLFGREGCGAVVGIGLLLLLVGVALLLEAIS